MPKIKSATPEEIQIIKAHFASHAGYGIISDETAAAQTDLLKLIRNGRYDQATKKLRD